MTAGLGLEQLGDMRCWSWAGGRMRWEREAQDAAETQYTPRYQGGTRRWAFSAERGGQRQGPMRTPGGQVDTAKPRRRLGTLRVEEAAEVGRKPGGQAGGQAETTFGKKADSGNRDWHRQSHSQQDSPSQGSRQHGTCRGLGTCHTP